jgi:acyl dehydratase
VTVPCFEDIQVGDSVPELVRGPVTHIGLVRYSGACGDFNPIHTVPDVARLVGLEGIIAHGMLIMAYAGQLLTNWAGPSALRRFKVRFSGMTVPGESVRCEAKITKLIDDDPSGEALVEGRLTVKGAEDDSLKLKGDFTVAIPRRSD